MGAETGRNGHDRPAKWRMSHAQVRVLIPLLATLGMRDNSKICWLEWVFSTYCISHKTVIYSNM
jgi:hypothetical protein